MANPKIKIKRTQVTDMSSINLEPGELCVNTNMDLDNVYRGIIKYSNGSQRYIPTGTITGGLLLWRGLIELIIYLELPCFTLGENIY